MAGKRVNISALNPAQRDAATHIDGPLLILAGAGTGKTRVVTTRIAYLLSQGIRPDDVLAVTFTNKAATEMRERVSGMITEQAAKEVTVSTFHSLCVKVLRTSIDRLGYKKNFTIYTQSDQMGLLKRIIVRKAGRDEDLDPKAAQSAISSAKNKGETVSEDNDTLIAEVFDAYQRELKQLNAVDFDDLLLLAVQVLEDYPEVRQRWRQRFRYIMVDEFQDTNSLQMRLMKAIVDKGNNVCVVGDDDQSIYGWRGAQISNILDFERFFPAPKVVKLEENYRSVNSVLNLANSLIRHNLDRREKTLWSSKEAGVPARIIAMPDAETEAETIVMEILDSHRMEGRRWEEFAILIRMNTQSRIFEQTLRDRDVPYRIIGGQSFFERREVKDLLAYLCVLLNPDDDVSLLRVINNPPRGIGNGVIALAMDFSIERECSIYSVLRHTDFISQLTTRGRNAINRFTELLSNYGEMAADYDLNYAEMTEQLVKDIGFFECIKRQSKNGEEAENRSQNIREVIQGMHERIEKGPGRRRSKGLRDYLDSVALMQDREDKKDDEEGFGVSVITMHAAKGLEYPVVYIVGVEEGALPHMRSIEQGTKDEERRLFYVGITRAMEELTVTWCHSRKRWGNIVPCRPSSFFKELDPELCEQMSFEDLAAKPAAEEVAADYFARMKAMLSE